MQLLSKLGLPQKTRKTVEIEEKTGKTVEIHGFWGPQKLRRFEDNLVRKFPNSAGPLQMSQPSKLDFQPEERPATPGTPKKNLATGKSCRVILACVSCC